jgi:hypothetical protein
MRAAGQPPACRTMSASKPSRSVARQSGWLPYCLIPECSRAGRALPHLNAPGATSFARRCPRTLQSWRHSSSVTLRDLRRELKMAVHGPNRGALE